MKGKHDSNSPYSIQLLLLLLFWNEVPYMRVEQGTYSTESETLSLPWPALRYHSQNIPEARWQCVRVYAHTSAVGMLEYRCLARTYTEWTYPKPADSVSAVKEKPSILSHTSTDIWHRFKFQRPMFTTYWFQLFAFRNILNQFSHIWFL